MNELDRRLDSLWLCLGALLVFSIMTACLHREKKSESAEKRAEIRAIEDKEISYPARYQREPIMNPKSEIAQVQREKKSISDMEIKFAIRRLMSLGRVSWLDVKVQVEQGNVLMTGATDKMNEYERIRKLIPDLKGVSNVKDTVALIQAPAHRPEVMSVGAFLWDLFWPLILAAVGFAVLIGVIGFEAAVLKTKIFKLRQIAKDYSSENARRLESHPI